MTSVDFTACFEWLNEDWQSIGLWPTPNFGLTGYKTHYLLCYVGARGLKTDRERERRLDESEAMSEKKEFEK